MKKYLSLALALVMCLSLMSIPALALELPYWETDILGLIPDNLKGEDMEKAITRAEFAAVAVKTYEVLSETAAIPEANNPFVDTNDVEVLKAYNLGIITGVAADRFDPDTLLNREQMATILARVYKKIVHGDVNFPLSPLEQNSFEDDTDISAWARDSVFFMFANGLIHGMSDNKFEPYTNETRGLSITIAARMVYFTIDSLK